MPRSLQLIDYSDREFIALVHDEARAAEDGWAQTADIAANLNIEHDRPNQCVGSRLSWMRHYGVVEKRDKGKGWRLTPDGMLFLNGRLTKTAQNQLEKMEPGQLYSVTRFLAGRQRTSGEATGHMLRREWVHGTARR